MANKKSKGGAGTGASGAKKATKKTGGTRSKAADGPVRAKSIRELARLVGRHASTVADWVKRPDWPFKKTPSWDPVEVGVWAKAALSHDPAAAYRNEAKQIHEDDEAGDGYAERYRKAKLEKMLEQARNLRLQADEREGKLHDIAGCQERRIRQIQTVKQAFLDLPRSIAPLLEGQTHVRIQGMLEERLRSIIEEFAR